MDIYTIRFLGWFWIIAFGLMGIFIHPLILIMSALALVYWFVAELFTPKKDRLNLPAIKRPSIKPSNKNFVNDADKRWQRYWDGRNDNNLE